MVRFVTSVFGDAAVILDAFGRNTYNQVGGVLPAVRAGRVPVTVALRAV